MSFDIIVGAQSGNEGKSKFSRFYSTRWKHYDAAIKIGGYCSNTFYDENLERMVTSRMIPAATNDDNDMLYIFPKDSYVDLDMVKDEARERKIPLNNILIDEFAIKKDGGYKHLRDYEGMEITDTYKIFSQMEDDDIIVEGQGGYRIGKGIHDAFPFEVPMIVPTMTASGIASLLNIGPGDINDVILVSRIEDTTVLIPSEYYLMTSNIWVDIIQGEYDKKLLIPDKIYDRSSEYIYMVSRAIYANSPDILVLNFLDLVDSKEGKGTEEFTSAQMDKVNWIEENLGVTIDFIGNGETRMSHLDDPEEEENKNKEYSTKMILPSSRIPSRELYEGKPFEERYRCNCGTLYGKIREGFICGNCKQPVVYHEPKEKN